MTWAAWAEQRVAELDAAGLRRFVRDFDARGPHGRVDGRPVVSFASNDYLGLGSHPEVVSAAREAIERWGAGAGAARLVTGARPVHSWLERAIAEWKGVEDALLFPTGYAANLGVLQALGGSGTLICSDALNHASIVDGCRLARAEVAVYPHSDVSALEALLAAAQRAVVVTESVFSMDGDRAPIAAIASLCSRHEALLVIDEAHAVLEDEYDLARAEVLRVGTLSKFLGSLGGYVAGSGPVIDWLRNTARTFVFTTAPSPADAGAALRALEIFQSSEGRALVARLQSLVGALVPEPQSPIVPMVIGSESAALEASQRLLDAGMFVPAIRPPSVPAGTARLRITFSSLHSHHDVARLRTALNTLQPVGV